MNRSVDVVFDTVPYKQEDTKNLSLGPIFSPRFGRGCIFNRKSKLSKVCLKVFTDFTFRAFHDSNDCKTNYEHWCNMAPLDFAFVVDIVVWNVRQIKTCIFYCLAIDSVWWACHFSVCRGWPFLSACIIYTADCQR